ncbi:hypothetical protein GALL_540730 [mine drainage metagenome]|uniref:Uncharacterized protein n=1 Tax=mine drainage metagenome TaxID=410659 RepID=A0A1J5P1B9_9ZZZZ
MIRARPCTSSVMTPAWDPVNDRASTPRFAIAIASSAIEMRSPAVSSMSSSRFGGTGEISWARSRSSSVVSPMAETTTTTSSPARFASVIRFATRLMDSALATDEPPYFWTMRATVSTPGCSGRGDHDGLRRNVVLSALEHMRVTGESMTAHTAERSRSASRIPRHRRVARSSATLQNPHTIGTANDAPARAAGPSVGPWRSRGRSQGQTRARERSRAQGRALGPALGPGRRSAMGVGGASWSTGPIGPSVPSGPSRVST